MIHVNITDDVNSTREVIQERNHAMSSYALCLPESLKQASKRIAVADTTMNQFYKPIRYTIRYTPLMLAVQ